MTNINENSVVKFNDRVKIACLIGLGALTVSAVSCVTGGPKIDTKIVCTNFKPIKYVKSDSVKTISQVYAHNQVWDYFCLKD